MIFLHPFRISENAVFLSDTYCITSGLLPQAKACAFSFLLFRAERRAGSTEESMQKHPQSDGQGRSAGVFVFIFYFPGTFCAFRAGLPAAQLPQALQPAQAPQEAQLPPQERLPAFRSRIMPRSSSATSSVIARISAIFTKLTESQADIRSDPFGKCGGAGGKRSEKPHGAAEWRGEIRCGSASSPLYRA